MCQEPGYKKMTVRLEEVIMLRSANPNSRSRWDSGLSEMLTCLCDSVNGRELSGLSLFPCSPPNMGTAMRHPGEGH